MDRQQAAKLLGVTLPCPAHQLKAAFRRLAFFCHPDRGGKQEKFVEIRTAYELIVGDTKECTSICEIKATVDGTPLTDLGQGYPLNVAAKTCENCEGRGYRTIQRGEICGKCFGSGRLSAIKCLRCGGSGKFKKGNRVVGDCFRCKGTGAENPWYDSIMGFNFTIPCSDCQGTGQTGVKQEYALRCDECKGIGELKMFNPVLPRGLLGHGRH